MRAWTIIRRDLAASWKGLAVGAAAIVVLWLFISSVVPSAGGQTPPDPYRVIRTPMFGIALLPSMIALSVSAVRVYGGDVMEGRTQSMFHYSMSYNEVHTIKAVSSMIPGALVSLLFCILVIPALAASAGLTGAEAYTFALTVWGVIMFAAIVIWAWALGLSTLIAQGTGKLTFAFHRLFALSFGLSLFATEAILETVGLFILRVLGVIRTPQGVADWQELAGTLATLSPIHAAGRMLTNATGGNVPSDLQVVLPLAVAALVGGYIFGSRLYPDTFLQQVTS